MLSSILLSIRAFFSREQLCVDVTFLFRRQLKIFNVEVSCIFGSVTLLVVRSEKFNIVFLNLTIFISPFFFNFCILPSNKIKLILSSPKSPYFAIIVEVSDLFPDNIFFKNEKFTGIIDFYFSCHDFYSFEIAVCLNALCFDGVKENLSFNVTKARKFIKGYTSVRKLNNDEKKYLKVLAQGASMRFLLTRVFDYLNLSKGALLTVKDPVEYLKRLEFHNSVKSFEDYCI